MSRDSLMTARRQAAGKGRRPGGAAHAAGRVQKLRAHMRARVGEGHLQLSVSGGVPGSFRNPGTCGWPGGGRVGGRRWSRDQPHWMAAGVVGGCEGPGTPGSGPGECPGERSARSHAPHITEITGCNVVSASTVDEGIVSMGTVCGRTGGTVWAAGVGSQSEHSPVGSVGVGRWAQTEWHSLQPWPGAGGSRSASRTCLSGEAAGDSSPLCRAYPGPLPRVYTVAEANQ